MKPVNSGYADVNGINLYNFIRSPEVPQLIARFLADPLTNVPAGAVAASQAEPVPTGHHGPRRDQRQ